MSAVPGPRGLPLIGSPWLVGRGLLDMLPDLARTYGDLVHFKVGRRRVYVLNHPDLIEAVWVRHRKKTQKDVVTRELSEVLGNGLLTSHGEHWKRQRKRISPSFRPRHLASYADTFVASTSARLPAPGPFDASVAMGELTLDIVIRTLFGAEPGGEAAAVGPLLECMMEAFETEQRSVWRFIPDSVPAVHRRAVAEGKRELQRVVHALIERGRERADGDDLLCRLLAARDEEGHAMTDDELCEELLTLFLAGHETTALTLAYALWLLAEHPEVQDEVHAELDALGGPAGLADLKRMPLLNGVLDETLRLYPAAWATGREALDDIDLGCGIIPKGSMIIASQWVVHRDARFWTGPSRFRPGRWQNGETDDLPRMAFFPFGGGERVCIGNHFARMEAMLVLATLLQERRYRAASGYRPELMPTVTLRARHGVQLIAEAR